MFPSKADIKFFYDMGIYKESDLDFYIRAECITEEEKNEILGIAHA
ncbi:XkdX family protein [Enterococcus avium]